MQKSPAIKRVWHWKAWVEICKIKPRNGYNLGFWLINKINVQYLQSTLYHAIVYISTTVCIAFVVNPFYTL